MNHARSLDLLTSSSARYHCAIAVPNIPIQFYTLISLSNFKRTYNRSIACSTHSITKDYYSFPVSFIPSTLITKGCNYVGKWLVDKPFCLSTDKILFHDNSYRVTYNSPLSAATDLGGGIRASTVWNTAPGNWLSNYNSRHGH